MLEVSVIAASFSTPGSWADSSIIGNLKSLNDLAKQANAHHIIHTGDFGFYDDSSLERIAEKLVAATSCTCRGLILTNVHLIGH